MTDSIEPQISNHTTSSWSAAPPPPPPVITTAPRIEPVPEKPADDEAKAKLITPALTELVYGYRNPAFMTDREGTIVCMNAAAGRLLDQRNGPDSSSISVDEWERKAELRADGQTFYLIIPELPNDQQARPETPLPPRLAKIARLVVSGCTDKQIASRTGLSFSTVRTYVRQIYRRVGVHSRVELVHATSRGLTAD